jgi:hypothetical protein
MCGLSVLLSTVCECWDKVAITSYCTVSWTGLYLTVIQNYIRLPWYRPLIVVNSVWSVESRLTIALPNRAWTVELQAVSDVCQVTTVCTCYFLFLFYRTLIIKTFFYVRSCSSDSYIFQSSSEYIFIKNPTISRANTRLAAVSVHATHWACQGSRLVSY